MQEIGADKQTSMSFSTSQLSKVISHALRHEPWLYELELDDQGWVLVESLLISLRKERLEWASLEEADLVEMIKCSEKKRHEIKGKRIRALYGHSVPGKLLKESAEPPELLYHGTLIEMIGVIGSDGLLPMSRHYVHLSVDAETARQVGARKTKSPVILTIRAHEAYRRGIRFYRGNDHVWLADRVAPEFIDIDTKKVTTPKR
jgi:putative RNA 2'-phosphotransferase